MPFAKIPKPDEDKGLGISWPAQETDMDALKALFEEMKAKLWNEGATFVGSRSGLTKNINNVLHITYSKEKCLVWICDLFYFLCASIHTLSISLFLHSMNAMQGVKYNTTTHTLPLMRLQTKSVGNRLFFPRTALGTLRFYAPNKAG